ncbi:alpha/beta hydrolase [Streptomyces sp. NPDC048664]|uniref:alpha/beta hydrolase n=1 Tax=Streptomyces sp. NPDC048664 TaxID=3154505 RepID=UPI00343B7563
MRRRVTALCGAGITVASVLAAVPAAAGASHPVTAMEVRQAAQPTWKPCGTDRFPTLQCTSVTAPLDYSRPQGRQITLALSRVPHTASTYQGPLLVNPGGPGGSGLHLAGFVASALPTNVAAQYDVIGFDPRGVGRSTPALNCEPGHFAPVRPDSVPTLPSLERANVERAAAFAKACATKYAQVLPFIDTDSAVRDMDTIRQALGAPQINYFGYSYGTYLGAVYAKLFPHRVRRLVLDSIVDPTGVWYDDNIQQDYAFNSRHQAFLAWVARHDGTYGLGTDPARVETKWYAMRAALSKTPAQNTVGASELDDTYIPGGYYNGYWPRLATAFAAYVNHGDAAPLVAAYKKIGAVDAAGDNGYSIYTAVQCRDASWPHEWARWRADTRAVYAKAPFMAWNNAWYNAPCAFWQQPPLRTADVSNRSLPPVLLFQATNDAATPYEGGVKVHHLLRGSSLVVEQGGGNHGITLSGNSCLDRYLAAYLGTGTVPRSGGDVDAVCERTPDPEPTGTRAASTASRNGAALHELLGFRR